MILDLQDCPYVNQDGLKVLAERAERLRLYGGGLKIIGATELFKHLVDLKGLERQLDIQPTEQRALERIRVGA